MNLIFMPMFAIGLMGVNRRLWDAGASYAHAQPTLQWQTHMTYAAFALAAVPAALHLEPVLTRRSDGEPGSGAWDRMTVPGITIRGIAILVA